jgi:hydrogenase expression/formation protein HypD
MAVWQARRMGVKNFSLLCSHVLVPPAMEAILSSPSNHVQGFLAAGHVCAIMGYEEYIPLASRYAIPIVVTGFEPLDLLQGIAMTVKQLEEGRHEVENQYTRAVRKEGNVRARRLLQEVFTVSDRAWRGIGIIPSSGFELREEYAAFDAARVFEVGTIAAQESPLCIAGQILQGWKKPYDCSAFGHQCTPEHPLGAPMVSSEGSCAAYYHYRRRQGTPAATP